MSAILDALAFQIVGWRGPLGRWAINRIINVWLQPLDEDGYLP